MIEISVKYGITFKKGKEFHRIDLAMRKEVEKGDNAYVDGEFRGMFIDLKREVKIQRKMVLND